MRSGGIFRARVSTFFLFACSAALLCAPAKATTVRAPTFETLVERAELIFTGRVVGQRCEWSARDGRRTIVTLVSFAVEKRHKGDSASVVTLEFLGGTVGDVSLEVTHMPRFVLGERAVLFVQGNGLVASPIVGFFHGRFPVRREHGVDTVWQHTGEPLGDISEIGRSHGKARVQASKAMSHAAFEMKIRGQAGARSGNAR